MSVLYTYLLQERFISKPSFSLSTHLHSNAVAHIRLLANGCSAQGHINLSCSGQEHHLSVTLPRFWFQTNEGIPARLCSCYLNHFHWVESCAGKVETKRKDKRADPTLGSRPQNNIAVLLHFPKEPLSDYHMDKNGVGMGLFGLISPLRMFSIGAWPEKFNDPI